MTEPSADLILAAIIEAAGGEVRVPSSALIDPPQELRVFDDTASGQRVYQSRRTSDRVRAIRTLAATAYATSSGGTADERMAAVISAVRPFIEADALRKAAGDETAPAVARAWLRVRADEIEARS